MDEATRERQRELGRQGGLKSAETRRRKAQMRADLKARQKFVDAAEEVAGELLDAALKRGKWAEVNLDPKERAALLKTCLEYGVGRPRAQDPMAVDDSETDTPTTGFKFGVADAPGGDVQEAAHEGDSPQPRGTD